MSVHHLYAGSALSVFVRSRIESFMPDGSDEVVAEKIGYRDTKMLWAIMCGETRLPLDKVLPLSHAIGADVGWLLRMTAQSYSPCLVELVDALLASSAAQMT